MADEEKLEVGRSATTSRTSLFILSLEKIAPRTSVKAPASRRGIIRSTLCRRRIGSLRSKFVSFYQSS